MKWKVLVLVITALVYSISADKPAIRGRIFNGQEAVKGQFKYIAALATRNASPYLSQQWEIYGGALIALNWVLTAAHCVYQKSEIYVSLGIFDMYEAEINYLLDYKHVSLHPNYNRNTLWNDIALIRIPRTRECDEIAYARMPYQWIASDNLRNKVAIAMGWGRIGDDGDTSTRLLWTQVKTISNEQCNVEFGDIIDTDLCVSTADPYGSPCKGDSGGPLVLKDTGELIGVLSAVPRKSCKGGKPTIFVRISELIFGILTGSISLNLLLP